ncbi:MAG: iron-sulfur cluster assembly protein IscA [Ostreibacterium sp.]
MNIIVTEVAIQRMKTFLIHRGKGLGIRLGVQTSGCSGMAYIIEFVDELLPDDHIIEHSGVKVIVGTKAMIYLNGVTVDFRKEGLNEGFRFQNPNASAECGCGESFTI